MLEGSKKQRMVTGYMENREVEDNWREVQSNRQGQGGFQRIMHNSDFMLGLSMLNREVEPVSPESHRLGVKKISLGMVQQGMLETHCQLMAGSTGPIIVDGSAESKGREPGAILTCCTFTWEQWVSLVIFSNRGSPGKVMMVELHK